MQPGVLLMGCLLALYLVAMVIFWQCLRGHKSEELLGTEGTHGKEMCYLRHSPGYSVSRFCLSRPPQRKRRRDVRVLCDQRTG